MICKEIHTEKQLLDDISIGDEAAFGIIYQRYYLQLKPLIGRYTHSDSETEEILQETFIKLWLNRDKLATIQNFRAWIFKIASREYLMYIRKKLHYEKKLNLLAGNAISHRCDTPLELTSLHEVKNRLKEAISRMPQQRRTIYEMSRNQGLKAEQIAEQLSITSRTVKNVLSTSSKYLREYLIAEGHGPFIIIYLMLNIL